MKSALKKLQYIENLIIVVSFAVMVICSFLSVVNRNFIKLSIPWFDELSTFAMIYMALLGTEAGLRDGSQIAVTALVNKFHGASKTALEIIAKIVVTIFSAIVLYYSCHMAAMQAASGSTSYSDGNPLFSISYQLCHHNLRSRDYCYHYARSL